MGFKRLNLCEVLHKLRLFEVRPVWVSDGAHGKNGSCHQSLVKSFPEKTPSHFKMQYIIYCYLEFCECCQCTLSYMFSLCFDENVTPVYGG